MSDEVIYVPARSNTHILWVQKWTSDYRESYWMNVEKYADTPDGLVEAKRHADELAATGARVQLVRRATS